MPHSTEQVLLTLAGLAYRGFHDLLRGAPHADAVRGPLLDGLHTLPPVKGEWILVWGPVTSRSGPDAFDSAAMYVVQNRRAPTRYVVVIRGTNPISASDWLFGDFWVSATVPWPYARAADEVAISASSALGLSKLQAMRSPRLELAPAPDRGRRAATQDAVHAQVAQIAGSWRRFAEGPTAWVQNHVVDRLKTAVSLSWMDLRLRPLGASDDGGLDLLTFFADEAHAAGEALDVVVTGHSKGGALAAVVALWLRELLVSPDAVERWDGGRGARVACPAFAAPTPGNAAFADRIDAVLGSDHHHLRNMHDVVTHAWQVDELELVPELYAPRHTVLEALICTKAGLGSRCTKAGLGSHVREQALCHPRSIYAPQEDVMSNKETALKFVERVINGHDLNAIDQVLSADFVEHSAPPGFASNRAGVKEMFGAFFAAFPDMHVRIDDVIVEGDKVVMRATATGTHKGPFMGIPATNKFFSINEIHIVQVRGEQCVAHWGVVDMAAMMRQIGVMPPPGGKP